MAEQDEENIVVKEILNQFFDDISKDKNIPTSLLGQLESLRNEKKIAKGDHLKSLLISFEQKETSNEI